MRYFVQLASLALLLFAAPVWGEGVGWRGDGSGRYPKADPPTQWDIDQGTNILWQIAGGWSTLMALVHSLTEASYGRDD